ncbi:MAG: glycosyltransferase [Gammaproteobacteria bacterium]
MKICQVVASSGVGGLEKHVQELCNELAKQEDVTLIAPPEMLPFISGAVRFVAMDFSRSRYNPILLWDLLTHLRQGNYDIIHAQANKAVSIVSRMRWWLPGKIIGTVHNSRRSKGSVFKNVSHAIAVSQEVAHVMSAKVPLSVVYNGIRLDQEVQVLSKRQVCREFDLDAEKPLLCSIGRLVDAKGFDLLIEALQDVDANMLIIGEGKLRTRLQDLIDQYSLQDRVKLIGQRNDVIKVLGAMDGMIISSRNEGFSYVFVEALLTKTPVLATDVSAKEFLPPSLIMEKSARSMSNKMNEYVFAPLRWEQQMRTAFDRAEQELTLDSMVERTLSVYREVLKASH